MSVNEEFVANSNEENISHADAEKPHMESHVNSHVKLNVEAFIPAFETPSVLVGEPPESANEPRVTTKSSGKLVIVDGHSIDTPVINTLLDYIFNDNYISSE